MPGSVTISIRELAALCFLQPMSRNLTALSFRKGLDSNIFAKMVEFGSAAGTAETLEAVRALAEEHLVGDAISLGAVSFYDFLKKENAGKKVFVCNGSACLWRGRRRSCRETCGRISMRRKSATFAALGGAISARRFSIRDGITPGRRTEGMEALFQDG